MSHEIPSAVLSDTLKEAIGGRSVRAGLFTTFSFEPEFFEDEILPLLFDQAFAHVARVRRAQLDDRLRGVEDVSVYYDPRALVATGRASLDVRRIPMRRPGSFHPKLAILLVENPPDDGDDRITTESLVVLVASANLTRAGWWENVEVGHVVEIDEGSASAFGKDLLEFLNGLRQEDRTTEEHGALDRIAKFLRHRVERPAQASRARTLQPRLWHGQDTLPAFIHSVVEPKPGAFTLEVLSPYFDDQPDARTLAALVDALQPRETRVLLPVHPDGRAACDARYFAAVAAMPRVRWCRLPPEVTHRSRDRGENQPDRTVHAKVYRLWSQDEGREFLLVGSPNLTGAAHGRASGGNLEAAALIDLGPGRAPKAWLAPLAANQQPREFGPPLDDEADTSVEVPPLALRHLWGRKRTEYFWDAPDVPRRIALSNHGVPLTSLTKVVAGRWVAFPPAASEAMDLLLRSTSYVQASVDGKPEATLLVCEEEMAHAPSVLLTLTVEEILRYWALLSKEQQEAFLEGKLTRELVAAGVISEEEAVRLDERWKKAQQESLFDHFAGIFHAFARLEEVVRESLSGGATREAEYRLFGEKYDSLPVLLEKVLEDTAGDPVTRYVTMLTARQLVTRLQRDHPGFFRDHAAQARELTARLQRSGEVRAAVDLGKEKEPERFLDWFEKRFLAEAAAGGES